MRGCIRREKKWGVSDKEDENGRGGRNGDREKWRKRIQSGPS